MPPNEQKNYSFEISLSVLNHLGRNLYRSFATVLGEAISNSWDANAKNVWIYVDREKSSLLIKDDGDGMTSGDFQGKFLKIGYSKRREGESISSLGRPYIGRKGIGKLALLSCADQISVISKTETTDFVGGVIDNSGLELAIRDDVTAGEYELGTLNREVFDNYLANLEHGTLIYFSNIKPSIRNTLDNLKKTAALYFRFSLLDTSFKIFINDEIVDVECLSDLTNSSEFLWRINNLTDPYLSNLESVFTTKNNEVRLLSIDPRIQGFIASVSKPSDLKIRGMDEAVKVDLFVNGRLRERDILKHIPTARVAESYLYGQIHFNELDDVEKDRFTSSRESVVANDPKFDWLLETVLKEIVRVILVDWDDWRRKHRKAGDSEDKRISKKARKSEELYNVVSEEYLSVSDDQSENSQLVDTWIDDLLIDAKFNFGSYAECFIAENLMRKFVEHKEIPLNSGAQTEVARVKARESSNKAEGNVNISIRNSEEGVSYLDMKFLAELVDTPGGNIGLYKDSKEYRPIRDAVMHTSLLSDPAKRKLTTVFDNIRARVKILLHPESS